MNRSLQVTGTKLSSSKPQQISENRKVKMELKPETMKKLIEEKFLRKQYMRKLKSSKQ